MYTKPGNTILLGPFCSKELKLGLAAELSIIYKESTETFKSNQLFAVFKLDVFWWNWCIVVCTWLVAEKAGKLQGKLQLLDTIGTYFKDYPSDSLEYVRWQTSG